MRTVVIVGSSRTRSFPRAEGGAWVYTPRQVEGQKPFDKVRSRMSKNQLEKRGFPSCGCFVPQRSLGW